MKVDYIEAPLYKIDNVPAFMAGEWEGSKSNKFERTRLCIRPHDLKDVLHGCDFFNANPQKRHFDRKYSIEKSFKPSIKTFERAYYTSKDIDKVKEIWPTKKTELAINLTPKKHYFHYRDKYQKDLLKKYSNVKTIQIDEDMEFLSKIGMLNKKNIELDDVKKQFSSKINIDHNDHDNKQVKKLKLSSSINVKRDIAISELKYRMELVQKDIGYVFGLNKWDEKFILTDKK